MDHVLHAVLVVIALAVFAVAPLGVAIPVAAVLAAGSIALFMAANRALRLPPKTGIESLVGGVGRVVEWQGRSGLVWHKGEIWRAASRDPLEPKSYVRITSVEGTLVHVRPASAAEVLPD